MHPANSSGERVHDYNVVQGSYTIKCEYPDETTALTDWHAQQPHPNMNYVVPAPHHISRLSTLSPVISEIARQAPRARVEERWTLGLTTEWELLPCAEYDRGRPTTAGNHVVDFRCYGGQELVLSNALRRNCDDLVDGEAPALPFDVSAKISIRIEFPNCVPYTRQIMARRSTNTAEPISRKVLAWKIAEEMDKCLDKTRKAGQPLMYRGEVVNMEHLALCELRRASSGSWVPVFKILVMRCN
ncbi:hypothetical protein C8Q76DRAFT_741927 [Earliella scabrosa]|nr:hypothetical protein C8Q76DRAFT_741927 [Earliella scabrosa]